MAVYNADRSILAGTDLRADVPEAVIARRFTLIAFAAGLPTVFYVLAWQQALSRVFGADAEALTVIASGWLFFMALGALWSAAVVHRARYDVRVLLAAAQALTCVFGLGSLALIDRVGALAEGFGMTMAAGVAVVILLPPTVLMGAVVPLCADGLMPSFGVPSRALALPAYVHTLGAGIGCFLCVALLFPFFGVQSTALTAVVINAGLALATSLQRLGPGDARPMAPRVAGRRFAATSVLALAGAGGAIAASYEGLLSRLVFYASGGAASAAVVVLGVGLVGFAAGLRRGGDLCASDDAAVPARGLLRNMSFAAAAGLLLLPMVTAATIVPGMALLVMLVAAFYVARAWGMLVPCLVRHDVDAGGSAERHVAQLWCATLAGCAAGGAFTRYVLMDHLTLIGTGQLLLFAALAGLLGAVWLLRSVVGAVRPHLVVVIILGLAAAVVPVVSQGLIEGLQFQGSAQRATAPFAHVLENRNGIVAVDVGGRVFGDGERVGRFDTSPSNDDSGQMRAYSIGLLHAAPRQVLMLGLGSGAAARVVAADPKVAHLTIVEPNPAYAELMRERPEIAPLLHDPRVEQIMADPRRWLLGQKTQKFDVIVANTTSNVREDTARLLSAEFMRIALDHLMPGGIFIFDAATSARVQATACAAPHGLRMFGNMAISDRAIVPDFPGWARRLAALRIGGAPVFDQTRADDTVAFSRLLGLEGVLTRKAADSSRKSLETCAEIAARTPNLTPVTDDDMGSEWRDLYGLE